jgi:hypothetical protein
VLIDHLDDIMLYVIIAIYVSLFVPLKLGRTPETLRDVSPLTKVSAGLIWPVLLVAVVAGLVAGWRNRTRP